MFYLTRAGAKSPPMSTFIEFDPTWEFSPNAVVAASVEHSAEGILVGRDALPPAFFDLSTRIAGDLTQRLGLYGVRLACVVPDLAEHSERFREFAREANQGDQVRFFESRASAGEWLGSA